MVKKELSASPGQGARRRHGLHPDRHHDRGQPPTGSANNKIHKPVPIRPRPRRASSSGRGLRRLHDRRLGPRRQSRANSNPKRFHHSARDHLEGAWPLVRQVTILGRRGALGLLRAGRGRGIRHQIEQSRRDGQTGQSGGPADPRHPRAISASSASTMTGPSGRSPRTAISADLRQASGRGHPINLARGLNAQWYRGGLQYAPPFRWETGHPGAPGFRRAVSRGGAPGSDGSGAPRGDDRR